MKSKIGLWSIIVFLGVVGFILLISSPSETQSAVAMGISMPRLLVALVMLALLVGAFTILFQLIKRPFKIEAVFNAGTRRLGQYHIFLLLAFLTGVFFFSLAAFFVFTFPPLASRMEMLNVVFWHISPLVAWLGISSMLMASKLFTSRREELRAKWQIGKWYGLVAFLAIVLLALAAGFVLILIFSIVTFYLKIVTYYCLVAAVGLGVLINWCRLAIKYSGTQCWADLQRYPRLIIIFLAFFLIYNLTAVLVGNENTPNKSYMDELAYAFLDGNLYLENPSSTVDLTLFQGKWYVAFPPMATLLMVPLAFVFANFGINTVTFTIFFSAINTVLVFEMLQLLAERGWTQLKTRDNQWLLVLFGLGTIHWYMSFNGKVWFISRLVALTFMLLATVLALKNRSPWLVGLSVGMSILARPNLVFLWPFLLGIYWQNLLEEGPIKIKHLISWTFKNAVPIGLGVVGLLYYNELRFGNWLDFGYATMNVGENAEVIRQYGQFNLRFIPWNLYYMWLSLPVISQSCNNLLVPNVQGISLILTTPPILYLFKAFKRSIWVVGAWTVLVVQMILLSMHTGTAWEFGYRFFMDFVIPVMALIALAAGTRVSGVLKCLIILGVIVNIWGVVWYYGLWC